MERAGMAPVAADRPGRATAVSAGGKYLWVATIALAIVLLDQATKLWVVASMRLHESIPVVAGFFDLTYVRNPGAAFSMFATQAPGFRVPFFIAVSIVAVLVILSFVRHIPAHRKLALAACAFVLGGAVGNLIDRILYGEVIDFLDVYWGTWHWPAFNVADSFITVGVILLLVRGLVGRDGDEPERAA